MREPTWKTADGQVQLWLGDCREILADFPLSSINCFLTDPPFGVRRPSAWRSDDARFQEIVGNESVDATWCGLAYDAAADGACCYSFCTWDTLAQWRSGLALAGWRVRSCIVWDKMIHGLADLQTCWAPRHELILFSAKGRHELLGARPIDVVQHQRVSDLQHPYQKPVSLIGELLRTNAGVVCDPYMGSGTTALACLQAGRLFRGIEIAEEYFDVAVQRITEESRRYSLFEPEPVIQRTFA